MASGWWRHHHGMGLVEVLAILILLADVLVKAVVDALVRVVMEAVAVEDMVLMV